jgi:PIN domain nuclease of toxin-antitoxin system
VKYIIDTHALVWWLRDRPALSARARAAIANPQSEILVSAVSHYEIAFKAAIGKIDSDIVVMLPLVLRQDRFQGLDLTPDVALAAGRLPPEHRDPWDRIIAMQSIANGWPVITSDLAIAALGAKTLW